MSRPTLIFDLDGTLAHSLPGIAASLNRVLGTAGCPTHAEDSVRRFIGNGARMLATRALPSGSDSAMIDWVEQAFKEDYGATWHQGTAPFAGIPGLLAELTAAGLPMAVLSNKPHPFTTAMVRGLFPNTHFSVVIGQRPGVPHKPAPDGILEIAVRLDADVRNCWMIGDSTMDLATARNSGARAVAVAWGYHPPDVLAAHGPDFMAATPEHLLSMTRQTLAAS